MKFKDLLTIVFVLAGTAMFAAPYTVINEHFTHDGCRYWRVTVWDDNGTPHDTSDDIQMAKGTLNDCDDQPGNGDPNNGPIHTVVADTYTMQNDLGQDCTFYVVRILDGSERIIAGQTLLGTCED